MRKRIFILHEIDLTLMTASIKVKLITGRTIEQGVNLENKMSKAYQDIAAVCELPEADAKRLGLKDGKNVRVTTKFGSAVLRSKENADSPNGIAFVPMGPWANALIDPDTGGCGMPGFKGIDAEVSATNEQVLPVVRLLGGKGK